jgi:ABC-2 type transport system permease protein
MAVLFFSGQIAPLARLGERVGFREGAAFGAAILAGGLIIYSFWLILATPAFWLVRVGNILMIFQNVYSAGRWPVSIDPAWLTT